jgi:hypothetical protein
MNYVSCVYDAISIDFAGALRHDHRLCLEHIIDKCDDVGCGAGSCTSHISRHVRPDRTDLCGILESVMVAAEDSPSILGPQLKRGEQG